ncbi:PiggyBac transposable element-derived protein 4 [Plakobranchus ocellatus]|uniref:PiggyBac transposable element-derived protein 4 n=1 Tax=Plakobranchus ocellatus TaxID=259542 RepID=A0AAV4D6Z6_9GAST|nr:PiggyBac transposable element-derived protein 4 [Plakobranchus ocellatus]
MFPLKLVFDLKSGETIVRCAFTRNRFLKLCNRLRFDDKSSRNQRRERDLFAPIRDLWEQFLKTLKSHYIPGVSVTVDEQLVPWRGRLRDGDRQTDCQTNYYCHGPCSRH